MMSEREKILGRIREALTITAPMPGGHGWKGQGPTAPRAAAISARQWLPPVGSSAGDQLGLFLQNAADLRATCHVVPDLQSAGNFLQHHPWKRIATHGSAMAAELAALLNLPVLDTTHPYAVNELESCDAGISECDALIAQTGSVLLTSRSGGGRALSVLPPHHVVVARRSQLLADLPAAYELLHARYGGDWPSFTTLITGPSRTGDIERILVLGAHGPKELTIFILP